MRVNWSSGLNLMSMVDGLHGVISCVHLITKWHIARNCKKLKKKH